MSEGFPRGAMPVCGILDGLAALLELVATVYRDSDHQDLRNRADSASLLADQIRSHRSDLVPTAINPNTGDTTPGDGYGVIQEWRNNLAYALTYGHIDAHHLLTPVPEPGLPGER
ncbi:hypothetical protein O7626_30450 [Micromonospora sp. WMMD1102]|uniref:hypothetical protein n=1 Tax=Micromonospora sp. WMMD1102 TaxID=3016105 RepID=UPI0024151B44|nr:hypothetical protein [Micromonospora sp. WMMD1102]MDG4790193.1 hypothetical protein [Micromonospora sp. WMMD1102]